MMRVITHQQNERFCQEYHLKQQIYTQNQLQRIIQLTAIHLLAHLRFIQMKILVLRVLQGHQDRMEKKRF